MGLKDIVRTVKDLPREEWATAEVTPKEKELIIARKSQLSQLGAQNIDLIIEFELLTGVIFHPDQISEEDFLSAGISHGCPVIPTIYFDVLGPHESTRTFESTWWSYITKNRGYRFIRQVITNSDNEFLLEDFDQIRPIEGESSTTIRRPDSLEIPTRVIQGIEKVELFWPSQLLRILEAISLGREDTINLESINIDYNPGDKNQFIEELGDFLSTVSPHFSEGILETMLDNLQNRSIHPDQVPILIQKQLQFVIPWAVLEDDIVSSESCIHIAINVAVAVVNILIDRNIPDEIIMQVLLKSYNVEGSLSEHGELSRVIVIWKGIVDRLSPSELSKRLAHEVQLRLQKYFI